MKIYLALLLHGCLSFEIERTHVDQVIFVPGKESHITPFKLKDFDEKAQYRLNITCKPALFCPPSFSKKIAGTGVELNNFLKAQTIIITIQAEGEGSVNIVVKDVKTGEAKDGAFAFDIVKSIKVKRVNNSAIFNWKFPAKLWEVLPPFELATLDVEYSPKDQGFSVIKFQNYIELHAPKVPHNVTLKVKLYDPRTSLSSDELIYSFSAHRNTKRKLLATFCAFLIAFLCIGLVWVIVSHLRSTRTLRKQQEEEEEFPSAITSPKPVSPPNHIVLPIHTATREV